MRVELDVANASGDLAPGSYATVAWPVERRHPTLFVPASSITTDQQKTFVIRIVEGKAQRVTVSLGQTAGDEIEVVGDLRAGDQVPPCRLKGPLERRFLQQLGTTPFA
jgi:hypothetical protein